MIVSPVYSLFVYYSFQHSFAISFGLPPRKKKKEKQAPLRPREPDIAGTFSVDFIA